MIFSLEEKRAEAPALLEAGGRTFTYGELRSQAGCFGRVLGGRCLIFCLCENTPAAVIGYLGALESRAVPLLLGAGLNREQFDIFYRIYEPAYIWADLEWEGRLGGRVCGRVYEFAGYGLWKTAFEAYPLHSSLALLLATSGSTGSPKLVRLSRENLESNGAAIRQYLGLDETERPITTLPMQYTYGLSIINSHLLAGACILMTRESYVQKGFWDFFHQQGATSFGGVPDTYRILKQMHIFEKEMPSLRSITQAGGKLPAALQGEIGRWAKEHGVDFFVMYGQTEATSRMAYLPPEICLEKLGSIGIAIPGGRFWLADEQGRPICEPGRVGELVYEGPNVSLGYAGTKEELLLGDENKGVLFTGDMARFDEDGCYYVAGRKKRFVKLFGVRVSLDACEQMLMSYYGNGNTDGAGTDASGEPAGGDDGVPLEIACTGVDNCLEIYGTSREAMESAADVLADYLNMSFKAFRAHYVPALPKNEAGKIQYAKLAEGLEEEENA